MRVLSGQCSIGGAGAVRRDLDRPFGVDSVRRCSATGQLKFGEAVAKRVLRRGQANGEFRAFALLAIAAMIERSLKRMSAATGDDRRGWWASRNSTASQFPVW